MQAKTSNFFLAAVLILTANTAQAGSNSSSATSTTTVQTVNMVINSTSNITTSGNPGTMTVTLDSTGAGTATDSTTTYTVTSNSNASGSLKITGAISSGGSMPTNTSLQIALASNKGTSAGAQSLTAQNVDLVSKLPTLLSDTASISYTFSVTNGWTVAASSIARTVTLTLTSG